MADSQVKAPTTRKVSRDSVGQGGEDDLFSIPEELLKDSESGDPDILINDKEDLDEAFEVLDIALSPGLSGEKDLGEESYKEKQTEPGQDEEDTEARERSISPIVYDIGGKERRKIKEEQKPLENKITDKLFENTRYFVMKSNNFDNIQLAKEKCLWSTPPLNEKKLDRAFSDCRNVLLIFSVKESGRFQGLARLLSGARRDISPPKWVLPPGISSSGMAVFKLEWMHGGELAFTHTMHLKNPWNEGKPVKISRDGQEVEPSVGEQLCRLWISNAEAPSAATRQTITSSKRPSRPHTHTAQTAALHHVQSMAMIPAQAMQLQYMHQAMMTGQNPFGIPNIPSYQPMTSSSSTIASRGSIEDRLGERVRDRSPRRRSFSPYEYKSSSRRHKDSHHRRSDHRDDRRRDRHHDQRDKRSHHRHSRSPNEEYGGVKRDILLNGSYEDYLKEYTSRHSKKSLDPKEFDAMVEDFLNKKK